MEERFKYMKRALDLAKKGAGWTSPNPLVGAVIVKNGHVIGEGYHERYGEQHAERNALDACSESPEGADLYVTLEPCCHTGKQPPCTDAVIAAGINRVFVGSDDPNPLVAGKGIQILRDAGIEVITGVLKDECDALNKIFFHYIQTKRPYVILKYAMTLDGKISAYTGASRGITEKEALRHVHQSRNRCSAIMIGIGTAVIDDPMLNCRLEGGRDPVRVICDTHLKLPFNSKIVQTAREIPTIIATSCQDEQKREDLEDTGCRIWVVPEKDGHVDVNALFERLGEEGIDSVLVEGGETLNWSVIQSGAVNKVEAYIAPKILGGKKAKSPIGGLGFASPDESLHIVNTKITQYGHDFLIEGEVE